MFNNYLTLSALFLGTAVFGMGTEYANAQSASNQAGSKASTPSAPVGPVSQTVKQQQASQQQAPRFFKRDLDFELKMFDYNVRAAVQRLVDDPNNRFNLRAIFDLSKRYDDPRKAEYLSDMIEQLLQYPNDDVKAYGALWADFSLAANSHHPSMQKKVAKVATLLSGVVTGNDSGKARGNALMALSTIAQVYTQHQDLAYKALLAVKDDKNEYVRQHVASSIVDVGATIDPIKVRQVLEGYLKDSDPNVVNGAKNSLQRLDGLQKSAPQKPAAPSATLLPVPTN